jgi:hypothetical protein
VREVRALVNEPSHTVFSRNLTLVMRALLWGDIDVLNIIQNSVCTSQRMHYVSDINTNLRKEFVPHRECITSLI